MQKLTQTFKNMHGSLSMFYTYFVSTAITVKSQVAEIDHYIKPKWQAVIMVVATVVVVIDKVRRSVPTPAVPP